MRRAWALGTCVLLLAVLFAGCGRWPLAPNPASSTAPVRAAFYYGWYPNAWPQGSHYLPAAGHYSSADPSTVHKQVVAMQDAGLQAGISSWWGPGSITDERLPMQLRAADGTNFRWTVYYEHEGYADPSTAQITNDLRYLSRYTADPNWLRQGNRPVIFVYAGAHDGCSMASRWMSSPEAAKWYIVLKAFDGYRTCGSQPASWHQYSPAVRYDEQRPSKGAEPYSASVSPGFWPASAGAPVLPRDRVAWRSALQRMVASGAHWQLVTTWNEWIEGTGVEAVDARLHPTIANQYATIMREVLGAPAPVSGGTPPPTTRPTTTTTRPTTTTSTSRPTTTTTRPTTTTTTRPPPTTQPAQGVCGSTASPPSRYSHIVVLMNENRTWSGGASPAVGLGFSGGQQPYLHWLAQQCNYFSHFTETNTHQNSLPQYIGLTSGQNRSLISGDCNPGYPSSCYSTDDNIFRQVRLAGGTARNFVEGATKTCSTASGNPAKHIPALYYYGTYKDAAGVTHNDHDYCGQEVVPLSSLDPNNLPTFSVISPTLVHDGHDASDATVDAYDSQLLPKLLNGADYRSGNTAIFVLWDEDAQVPNLEIAPTARPGVNNAAGASDYSTLATWADMLGVPRIGGSAGLPSLRGAAHM